MGGREGVTSKGEGRDEIKANNTKTRQARHAVSVTFTGSG